MHPQFVGYAIIAIYFVFVLGIGFALRGRMKTSEGFFLSGTVPHFPGARPKT